MKKLKYLGNLKVYQVSKFALIQDFLKRGITKLIIKPYTKMKSNQYVIGFGAGFIFGMMIMATIIGAWK